MSPCRVCLVVTFVALLTLVVVLVSLAVAALVIYKAVYRYPVHAQCNIKWEFASLDCDAVYDRIAAQIEAWSDNVCPGTSETCPVLPCGQKCNYELLMGEQPFFLRLDKTTASGKYVDHVTLKFSEDDNSNCTVKAHSTSGVWYAFWDYGVNYCNLRNLVDGANLSVTEGFDEYSSIFDCTLYDNTNCERF